MNETKSRTIWFMPLPGLIAAITTLYLIADPSLSYEPSWLLPITNSFFVTVMCFIVAFIALRNYKATGRVQILLLGCGVLSFGVGAALAGFLRDVPAIGANLNVTVYNTAALVSSLFHFGAALILLTGIFPEIGARRKRFWLVFSYTGSALLILLFTMAALGGMVPPFFIQGIGPTALRQWVLGLSDILFAFSFIIFIRLYLRNRESFLYWYSTALALTSISLTAFFIQSAVGSLIGWAGRLSQYLAGIYFLIAVLTAIRSAQMRRTSLDDVLSASLSPAEEKFRALAEHSPDMIERFDKEMKYIYVNQAGIRSYGKPAGSIIGKPLEEARLPALRESIQTVFETAKPMQLEHYLSTENGVRFCQSHCVPEFGSDGTVVNVLVLSRDLTERKRAEEALHRQAKIQEAIKRIFEKALSCDTEEELGTICLGLAEELTGSGFGFIGEIGRDGRLHDIAISDPGWELCTMVDKTGHRRAPGNFKVRGLYGRVLDGKSLMTNTPSLHPDSVGVPEGHPPLTAFLGVPLIQGGKTIGLLAMGNRIGGYADEQQQDLEAVAPAILEALMRKRAEMQLKEIAEKYSTLFNATSDGVWIHNLSGEILEVNDAYCQMSGYSRDELIHASISRLETVDSPEEVSAYIKKLIEAGGHDRFESRHRRKDGSMFDVDITALFFEKEEGRIAIFVRDITDRKRMEETLRRSRDELEERVQKRTLELRTSEETARKGLAEIESYYRTAPIGLAVLDSNLRFVRINDRFAEMNGIPASKHIGRTIRDIVPSFADQADRLARQVLNSGEPVKDIELRGETAAQPGIERIWLQEWHPFKTDTGEVAGISIILQEITEQRGLEEQVRQKQKLEALGALAGGIAHDLNNALSPILINTEMALFDVPPESRVKGYLEIVIEALTRAKNLVKQILTFSAQKSFERKPVRIASVVEDSLKLLRSTLPKTMEIRKNIESADAAVLADATQIHQVMMNLCTNAAHAMRENGGVLEVTLKGIELSGDSKDNPPGISRGSYVKLTVSDTGVGIAPENLGRIFDPFFTTKGVNEGTGMGLSVVHGIVKSHRGAVMARSRLGKGSTFEVYLPVLESKENEDPVKPSLPRGTGERILLLDDEEMNVRTLQTSLEGLGYQVVGNTDGLKGLELFKSEPYVFDLVITDQTMPGITGVKLAQELMKVRPDVPIILCTGYSETVDEDRAKAMGIREFILKPFTMAELAEIIRRAVESR